MKKIMISYAAYGGGHLSAARNVKEYIETNYPDAEIYLFDFMKYINRVIDKISGSTYSRNYNKHSVVMGKNILSYPRTYL